jgi:hypothetical protein
MLIVYRAFKIVLWAVIFNLPRPTLAQITISAEDFPGDQIGYRQEMIAGMGFIPVNIGAAGANQIWDFRDIAFDTTQYTLAVDEIAAADFAEKIPEDAVEIEILPGVIDFFQETASALLGFGFLELEDEEAVIDEPAFACFNSPPLKLLQFPLTYGTTWTTEKIEQICNSEDEPPARIQYKFKVDAWGVIRIPAGNFRCLRLKTEKEEQFDDPDSGKTIIIRTIEYAWLTKGAHILALVESQPEETDPNFDQAYMVLLATHVPIPSEEIPPQMLAAKPPAATTPEPVRTRNAMPVNPSSMQAITEGSYYALIIAVQDYQEGSGIKDLDHPVQDAQNLVNVLTTRYTFDQPNLIFLKNPGRKQIIDTFNQLAQRVRENDNLLIFYAGHGYWEDRIKQGFWLPADAKRESQAEWLSNGAIQDYIRGIKSKHTLLITDACFGGGIFKTRSAFSEASRAIVELYKLPSRKAMTSGMLTEVPDKSVFIEYLLKRLNENAEPFLATLNLFASFNLAVTNNSQVRQVPVYGVIFETGDEGGDFVLMKRK